MLMLKKFLTKSFWLLFNIILVPLGYINLLIVTKNLKLKKIRVFNFFSLDDGNLNFTGIYDGSEVFIKVDMFGKNLKNELEAYKFLKKHELNFSIPKIFFFKNNILLTDFLRGSKTTDIFLKQNPHKYNWLLDEINKILNDLDKIKFKHNDFLLKNIIIFKDCIYLIDFYFSKYPGSYDLYNHHKKIAYNHTNSPKGDRKTFFEDLQNYNLFRNENSYNLNEIISIIVVFKPDLKKLKDILRVHASTFSNCVVVNNSSEIYLGDLPKNIRVITCNSNIGLASALNQGISYSKKMGFKMCALFDQDTNLSSSFAKDMINRINLYKSNTKVAVFSPIFFNNVTKSYGYNIKFKFNFLYLMRSKPNKKQLVLNPDYVITSGSFIPLESIDDVGLMLDKLFIDFIDIEWCLRAKRKKYSIVSFQDLVLSHNMGSSSFNFFGKNYPINDPQRMYYYFRNSFYLYHNENMPFGWKIVDFSRNLLRILFYLILVDFRLYFKPIFIGISHGFLNKMGKYVL